VPKALQVMTLDNRQRLMRRRPLAPPPNFVMDAKGVVGGVVGGLAEMVTVSSTTSFMQPVGSLSAAQAGTFPEIRSDFRPLVFWLGSVTTDSSGRASTTVTLPDSLTTYRVMAVAGDESSRFGFGEREIRVTNPLSLLPSFPRFLSKGDRASFGAVVTNSGKYAGNAVVTIQTLDSAVVQFGSAVKTTLAIGPGKSERVRFEAVARAAGTARVRMLVTLGGETDAFEMPLVVSESIRSEVTAAYGDTVATATEALALELAAPTSAGGLTVDLASTALVGVGESARYLEQYPYECAEQMASRTLALLLAADLGGAFTLSGIQPDEYKTQAVRALNGLYDYQCGSGGFALWPGRCGSESAYLTAYVLHVLNVAGKFKYTVNSVAVDRALDYLEQQLDEDPPEIQWWPAWAASQAYAVKVLAEFGRKQAEDIGRLAAMSERLPILALSYLADALAASNDRGLRYQVILQRLANSVRVEADRAHVEEIDEDALKWLWNTNVSATAVVLEGLSRRGDDATFVAPLVRWLLAARTNGRWGTTHENANVLEALVNYYRAFESDVPQMNATVKIGSATVGSAAFNGRSTKSEHFQVSMADLLKQVAAASSPTLSIAKTGTGRIFYTTRVERFVPESPNAIDRGFHVERRYERYVKDGSSPATAAFDAGDLIRVTTTVTLRGEGRYLALTDPLPAGVEAIDSWLQTTASDLARDATRVTGSDWMSWWRRGTFDHVEKHDDRIVAFATRLGSGRHEFSYLVRATTAGTFHAAGARLEAMYAPELEGRSEAVTLTIK
jgi:alpha-2-macroglobulin